MAKRPKIYQKIAVFLLNFSVKSVRTQEQILGATPEKKRTFTQT
jgi:hypothetical protein